MFDKHLYVTNKAEASRHYVSVEEKRAPTDESVRLLREMEAEARDAVYYSAKIENSHISAAFKVVMDPCAMTDWLYITMQINGGTHKAKREIDRSRLGENEYLVDQMYKILCEEVAAALMGDLMKDCKELFRRGF